MYGMHIILFYIIDQFLGVCYQSEEQEQPILVERHLCCVSTWTATIYFPTGERRHLNMGTIFQICSWSNVEMELLVRAHLFALLETHFSIFAHAYVSFQIVNYGFLDILYTTLYNVEMGIISTCTFVAIYWSF